MDKTLRSSKSEIEEFKKSFVWLDIVDELTQLAKNAQLEYDIVGEPHVDDEGYKIVPNSSETLIHLGDIKGRRKAVSYFLSLPDIFLQTLEIESKEESRNES